MKYSSAALLLLHNFFLYPGAFLVAFGTTQASVVDNGDSCSTDKSAESPARTVSEDERELEAGLNALPARIAVAAGQVSNLKTCGEWCQEKILQGVPGEPCRIDTNFLACQGDFHCVTTCALWNMSILMDPLNGFSMSEGAKDRPRVTCPMFKRFDGFVSSQTAEVCDPSCLLPEIQPRRYPAPTGAGLLCKKGTCYASSLSVGDAPPARLECPCNWFGSDCDSDWVAITGIEHTATFGESLMATTISVAKNDWEAIMQNHLPGGVVRLTRRDLDTGHVHEQPYAVASASKDNSTIDILTTSPDPKLHRVTRDVAEHVRALPMNVATVDPENLYINPSIAGFFNSNWQFLLDAISSMSIKNVILVSTGTGLSGTLSAMESVMPLLDDDGSSVTNVQLYHGVRMIQELPYKELLANYAKVTSKETFQMTLVESRDTRADENAYSHSSLPIGIHDAISRAATTKRKLLQNEGPTNGKKKVYVQDVLEQVLKTNSSNPGTALLESSVFVVCGRLALLDDTKAMIKGVFCGTDDDDFSCNQIVGPHFFTNI